jgi:membrane protease YdiL (CAAX protease family)
MLSERPWKLEGMIRLMVGILFCVFFFTVLQVVVQHFVGEARFAEGTLLYVVFGSLTIHGSIIAGTAYFLWSQRFSPGIFFGISLSPGRAVVYGILGALVFLPIGTLLQNLSIDFLTWYTHTEPDTQAAVQQFTKSPDWFSRGYLIFFAVMLAPVAEEILFRGIIFGVLRQARLRQFAYWGSALVFAVSHDTKAVFVPLLVFGFILAWLYERTDSLLTSITAHSLFNAINIVKMYLIGYLDQPHLPHH